jgi:GST-like protein
MKKKEEAVDDPCLVETGRPASGDAIILEMRVIRVNVCLLWGNARAGLRRSLASSPRAQCRSRQLDLDPARPHPSFTKDRMNDLSSFPITGKWPAAHPDRLQLYSLPTPNGVKVSIMLEEIGLPYEVHLVRFEANDQSSPAFLSLNPNNKIPAILDPNGPGGKPLALFESGAILIYLAEKTGKLLPADAAGRYETIQWLMFQMGGIGPMFGQLGFFHKFAGKDYEDKRPRDRYVAESQRLLAVLDGRLEGRAWIMGDDYGIADIATFPWVNNLVGFYGAREIVVFDNYPNVARVLAAFLARPAVKAGLQIPNRNP